MVPLQRGRTRVSSQLLSRGSPPGLRLQAVVAPHLQALLHEGVVGRPELVHEVEPVRQRPPPQLTAAVAFSTGIAAAASASAYSCSSVLSRDLRLRGPRTACPGRPGRSPLSSTWPVITPQPEVSGAIMLEGSPTNRNPR